jgi:hypothetical protein
MTYAHLQLLTPTTTKRTVMPRRLPNHELRLREHLTEREVEKLIEAAKRNRHGQRDSTIILMCFRHGPPFDPMVLIKSATVGHISYWGF